MGEEQSIFNLMLSKFLSKELEDPPEQWIGLNQRIKVNELPGHQHPDATSNGPKHSFNENMNEQIYLFYMLL